MGGRKSAKLGYLRNGVLLLLEHITCLFDANGIEIGDEGNAYIFAEEVRKIILGYSEMLRKHCNCQRLAVIVVYILYYFMASVVSLSLSLYGIRVLIWMRGDEIQYVKQQLCHGKLIIARFLYLIANVFLKRCKQQLLQLCRMLLRGCINKRLIRHYALYGLLREVFFKKFVLEVDQKSCCAEAVCSMDHILGNKHQLALLDMEKAIANEIFSLSLENIIKLIGMVIVHIPLRSFERVLFYIEILRFNISYWHTVPQNRHNNE